MPFTDDRAILIDSIVTKSEPDPDRHSVRFDEVSAQFVIELQSDLPSGTIDRSMGMEEILQVVAESFGDPVSCHPDQPPAGLYSGLWHGEALSVELLNLGTRFVCGTFYPDEGRCELVWAFNIDRYWEWLLRSHPQGLPRHKDAARLSATELVAMARESPSAFPAIRQIPETQQYALSTTVLRIFLGDEWCDSQLPGTPRAHHLFQQTGLEAEARMRAQSWTVALAEMLFNLQDVAGFDDRLEKLRSSELEAAVAELEAARLLVFSGLPFRFVEATGQKGSDYEMKVVLSGGDAASAEVKSKAESTPLSRQTILNSLKKAAGQVPADSPALIFLRLPASWLTKSQVRSTVETAVDTHFRKSGRVVAVVLFWEEWHLTETGALLRLAKFREMTNQKSTFYKPENSDLIKGLDDQPDPRRWVRFIDLRELGYLAFPPVLQVRPCREIPSRHQPLISRSEAHIPLSSTSRLDLCLGKVATWKTGSEKGARAPATLEPWIQLCSQRKSLWSEPRPSTCRCYTILSVAKR